MINTNKHVKINQSKNTLFDDSNWSYLGQTIYQYRIHSFCRPGINGPKPVGLGSSVSVRTSVGQQIGCIRPSTFILKDHPVSSCHLMSQNAIHFKRRFLVPSIFVRKEIMSSFAPRESRVWAPPQTEPFTFIYQDRPVLTVINEPGKRVIISDDHFKSFGL